MRAVQGELSRTISQLQGVRSARVMVVVPENRLLVANQQGGGATASVFINTGGTLLAQEAVNSIRFIVANAVEGLLLDNVAVVDNHGKVISENLRQEGLAGMGIGQFKYRKNIEDYFSQKIESMLGKVVGLGNVVARVSVEVDSETSTIVEEKFDPDGQVPRSETNTEDIVVTTEASSNQSGDDAGNGPQPAATNNTRETHKNKITSYEINSSTQETIKTPGTIKNISAAVFIAMRMEKAAEGEKASPISRTPEEIQILRVMVHNAIGVDVAGISGKGSVSLEEIIFHVPEVVPEDGLMKLQDQFLRWYDLGRNFFAIGIAIIMFVIFLRMVKRHKPGNAELAVLAEDNPNGLRKAAEITNFLTPDMLNELIQEKPENVSTALKNWATNGPAN